jgi:hypothetical protein
MDSVFAGVAAGSFHPVRIPMSGKIKMAISPLLATSTGPGQRATTTPSRRQRRLIAEGRGSSMPRRLAKPINAGVSVSAASMATKTPMAQGIPVLRNIATCASLKHANAVAMVSAEPMTTGATPR